MRSNHVLGLLLLGAGWLALHGCAGTGDRARAGRAGNGSAAGEELTSSPPETHEFPDAAADDSLGRAWESIPEYVVGKTTEAEFRKMWEDIEAVSVRFIPPARGEPAPFPGMTIDSAPIWTDAGVERPEDWDLSAWKPPDARDPGKAGEPVMEWRMVRQDEAGRRYWQGAYWDGTRLQLYGLTFRNGILESLHGPVDAD